MEIITAVFNFVNNLGGTLMMPIIFTILGLIVGMKFMDAFKSGLLYGIGFAGLWLVLDYFMGSLAEAANGISTNLGLHLDVIDAGWMLGSAMAFGSTLLPLAVVGILGVNILLILVGFVKTLNIDMWNYWIMITGGVLVQKYTGSYWIGLAAIILSSVVVTKLADVFADRAWEGEFVPEGITLPHEDTITMAPVYFGVNWVLNKIPKVRDWDISTEKIGEKIGVFGEPAVMGLILGALLGAGAGFDGLGILNIGMVCAATMVLMPKVCSILMEGLAPIAEATQEMASRKMKGREIRIGMDAAIGVGNPNVLILSILIIPIMLVLAMILPGNRMLPFADLSSMTLYILWAVIACRGNMFRALVAATVGAALYLLCGTYVAATYTETAVMMAPDMIPEGTMFVSSISAGNPLYTILLFICRLLGLGA
ncbi:MAG TPA: PTS galactitol transporter subunit IIC [Candidatus Fournierella pullicola]|uniref:PTS galactitol transporter subunit IIC n=1 Tax=Candidatus Allofournierella pullicola TaxID=2838596 RepID=A0A9D2ADX3_9FIRM|nr:PTS galactitol transporter subunit IIC [Candidatus Fournierella pullicola]